MLVYYALIFYIYMRVPCKRWISTSNGSWLWIKKKDV